MGEGARWGLHPDRPRPYRQGPVPDPQHRLEARQEDRKLKAGEPEVHRGWRTSRDRHGPPYALRLRALQRLQGARAYGGHGLEQPYHAREDHGGRLQAPEVIMADDALLDRTGSIVINKR